jgi:MioC protein
VRVVNLFGSEMGTAEAAADSIADVLAADHDASVYDMFDFDVEDLDVRDFRDSGSAC